MKTFFCLRRREISVNYELWEQLSEVGERTTSSGGAALVGSVHGKGLDAGMSDGKRIYGVYRHPKLNPLKSDSRRKLNFRSIPFIL